MKKETKTVIIILFFLIAFIAFISLSEITLFL